MEVYFKLFLSENQNGNICICWRVSAFLIEGNRLMGNCGELSWRASLFGVSRGYPDNLLILFNLVWECYPTSVISSLTFDMTVEIGFYDRHYLQV